MEGGLPSQLKDLSEPQQNSSFVSQHDASLANPDSTLEWVASLPPKFLDSSQGDVGALLSLNRRLCETICRATQNSCAAKSSEGKSVIQSCTQFLLCTDGPDDFEAQLGPNADLRHAVMSNSLSLALILSKGELLRITAEYADKLLSNTYFSTR